jgi:transposase InsO family protein
MEKPDIHDLWVSLNRPSAARFALALKKRGIKARASDISNLFTKDIGARQIFAPPPRLKGRVYSTGKDDRWMADIIVNSHMPSERNGTKYNAVLVAQDVFTRCAFAELMTTQSDATRAMEAIFRKARREGHSLPTQLITDEDGVFKAPSFRALMQRDGIVHTFKEARNDISTVDRLIGLLRRALAQESAQSGEADWASKLDQVVKGFNESPSSHLLGGSPADASKPEEHKGLAFQLDWNASEDMRHNATEIQKRRGKLEETGAFRTLVHAPKLGRRVYKNVWSERIHRLSGFDETGAHAKDEEGKLFLTKELLPVHPASTTTNLAAAQVKPANEKTRGMLRKYVDRVTALLTAKPNRAEALWRVAQALDKDPGNWREATKLAGLNQKRQMAALLEQFPELFEIKGSEVVLK